MQIAASKTNKKLLIHFLDKSNHVDRLDIRIKKKLTIALKIKIKNYGSKFSDNPKDVVIFHTFFTFVFIRL